MYRIAVLFALAAALGVTMTLRDSTISIHAAMSTCKGALGSVHFEHGQAMVFASAGVNESVGTSDYNGMQSIVFKNQTSGRKAAFDVYPKRRIVEAAHLQRKGAVYCVLPD